MKLVYKRSSAATALAMPEEIPASDMTYQEPSPAPAGALHRVYPAAVPADATDTEPYIPQRGSFGHRVRGGMPRGVAGRVLLGTGAFAVLGALALAVAGTHQFLMHDPRFMMNSASAIAIEGNNHIPRAEILSVFGSDLERDIFKVPLGERRDDLQRLPWVEHATVMRLLPNHLRVKIVERTPVAFTRQGSEIGLVDGSGVMLDMPPESAGDPHYSFPVLTGLALNDTPAVRAARMDVYLRFMGDLGTLGPHVTQSLSEVDVTNPEDVKALIATGGADILVHFGDDNFLARYQAFEKHLPEWRAQYPKLASADMRYERQVVLEMQGSSDVPPASGALPTPRAEVHPVASARPVGRPPAPAAARHPALTHTQAERAANQRVFARLAAQRRAALHRARGTAVR